MPDCDLESATSRERGLFRERDLITAGTEVGCDSDELAFLRPGAVAAIESAVSLILPETEPVSDPEVRRGLKPGIGVVHRHFSAGARLTDIEHHAELLRRVETAGQPTDTVAS
jgi:hypothetical protein